MLPSQSTSSHSAAAPTGTSASRGDDTFAKFNWLPQPEARKLLDELVKDFVKHLPEAAQLASRMKDQTGTRLMDWIDHIQTTGSAELRKRLAATGFVHQLEPGAPDTFVHPGAIFPTVVLTESGPVRVGIKVESVADFLRAHNASGPQIVGEPLGQLRIAAVFRAKGYELLAVERHGYRGLTPPAYDPVRAVRAQQHFEKLCLRKREYASDVDGFIEVNRLVDAAIADVGRDWACDIFFAAERDYWMRRNRAAQAQFARQQRLGLGWANHDHHTYRSSREHFTKLVGLWEKLGFVCRERFYAGHEAQWGAQVMEQSATGITTFNDVDMSPEELMGDFSHEGFTEQRAHLGTVGLWCGLHGEAVLQAGMHHLEAMFDFHALVQQLEATSHIRTMAPFTTFSYLRQAFTEGEPWDVSEDRIQRLVAKHFITQEQAETFRRDGAIGSHLENLERNDGFKGFNQQGVSDIIARTDPRRHKKMTQHSVGA